MLYSQLAKLEQWPVNISIFFFVSFRNFAPSDTSIEFHSNGDISTPRVRARGADRCRCSTRQTLILHHHSRAPTAWQFSCDVHS
jgi:hypothetical protein